MRITNALLSSKIIQRWIKLISRFLIYMHCEMSKGGISEDKTKTTPVFLLFAISYFSYIPPLIQKNVLLHVGFY